MINRERRELEKNREERSRESRRPLATQKRIAGNSGDDEMQNDIYPVPVEEITGQMVDPVQQVECPPLTFGKMRRAGEQVRVPQWKLAVAYRKHIEELHRHVQLRVVNPGKSAYPQQLPGKKYQRQQHDHP